MNRSNQTPQIGSIPGPIVFCTFVTCPEEKNGFHCTNKACRKKMNAHRLPLTLCRQNESVNSQKPRKSAEQMGEIQKPNKSAEKIPKLAEFGRRFLGGGGGLPFCLGGPQHFRAGDKNRSGPQVGLVATAPLQSGGSPTLQSGGQNQKWHTSGQIGYNTPAVLGSPTLQSGGQNQQSEAT